MKSDERERVLDTFCKVLEGQALMFAEDASGPTGPPLAPQNATIRFTGHFSGRMHLVVGEATSHEMAANVLGLDPDDEMVAAGAPDCLKEVLNVTCGHVLTCLAGPEPVFDLMPPELTGLSAAEWDTLAARDDTLAILIEDEPALLNITIES